jgi:BirA family transcriptional regulator, biotin operon repressor / biotin---[acetyl-CoA-carboxylase] ligase
VTAVVEGRVAFPARLEWFESVGSTNDVVADWLRQGEPEVCVAAAIEQTAGRGRNGRTWSAPAGAALLCSVGFRPAWLGADRTWRLAAIVSMAMAEAAEDVTVLRRGTIRLKWPNDLVVAFDRAGAPVSASGDTLATADIAVRKLGGVLGETDGLGTADPRAVIGIGVNADWPRSEFPAEIATTMTSLFDVCGRSVKPTALLDGFLACLQPHLEALRAGVFDAREWQRRQLTNGRPVRLERPDGTSETVQALGVDAESGGLVCADPAVEDGRRTVLVGEIRHLRIGGVV